MNTATTALFRNLLLLLISLFLTVILIYFVTKSNPFSGQLNLHVYDTMFVIETEVLTIPLFILITFIVFFTKQARSAFANDTGNWILLIFGTIWVALVTLISPLFTEYSTEQWNLNKTIYGADSNSISSTPINNTVPIILLFSQLLVLLLTMLAMFNWGRNKRKTT